MSFDTKKHNQKTTVSLYKFDSIEDYTNWYNVNKPTNDIISFVKNPGMQNGLDIYINNQSITATRFFLVSDDNKSSQELISDDFDNGAQYTISSISRASNMKEVIVGLKRLDQDSLIKKVKGTIGDLLETYLQDHPIDIGGVTDSRLLEVLTYNHYILRKLYTLLTPNVDPHLSFSFYPITSDKTKIESYYPYGSNPKITGFRLDVPVSTGTNPQISQIIISNDNNDILFNKHLNENESKDVLKNGLFISIDQIITVGYTKSYKMSILYNFENNLDSEYNNMEGHYDEKVQYKEYSSRIENTYKITIGPKPDDLYAFGILDEYKNKSNVQEKVDWFKNEIQNTDAFVAVQYGNNTDTVSKVFSNPKIKDSKKTWIYLMTPIKYKSAGLATSGFADTMELIDQTSEWMLFKSSVAQEVSNLKNFLLSEESGYKF